MKKLIVTAICVVSMLIGQPAIAQQDEDLFRRHIVSSGWHGLFYGIAVVRIMDSEGIEVVAGPIMTAGAAVLIPLITAPEITTNSLILTNHGKTIGWAHGASLSHLIFGDEAFKGNNYRFSWGAMVVSSIGLGRLGYVLGRDRPWSEGQAALYSHYGMIMPFIGFSAGLAFVDDSRIGGGLALLSGAGGYFLANQVYRMNPYTRGDVRATRVLSTLNAGLGYGLMLQLIEDDIFDERDIERSDLIIPAIGALAGTAIGHLWLRDTRLTTSQGNMSGFAATGGALMGLGMALMVAPTELWSYYTFPYALGMGAFAFAVERFRAANRTAELTPEHGKNNVTFAFTPQSLALNQKIAGDGPMTPLKIRRMQPLVSVAFRF
jgi:hypothetical protein